VYKEHPYQWATIGKEVSHIENATMEDVKDFFFKYYVPNNAILVVAGNVKLEQVKQLSEKWFGPIPAGNRSARKLPVEPAQLNKRTLEVSAKVPANALYKAFHMAGRFEEDFYAADLMSDILSRGNSSRLYRTLVQQKEIFTSISSFTMGSIDPGLIVISGRVKDGINLVDAEQEVNLILDDIRNNGVDQQELQKVKNQALATLEFGEVEVMNRAMNLAFAALSGNAELVNQEEDSIQAVTVQDIHRLANQIFQERNSSVMYYKAEQ
jgi:zinc protease